MSIIDKFSKRITIVSSKNTWTATMWAKALLERLDLANWDLSKVIIFDRNRKFLSKLWSNFFARLEVKLLYSTVYHSQTNDSFERINQTIEITLRYHIQILDDFRNWSSIVEVIQRTINNDIFFIDKSFNEICYDFTSTINTDLFTFNVRSSMSRIVVIDSIVMTQMSFKRLYDQKHQILDLKVENWVLLCLHKDYQISSTVILSSKLL